MSMASYGLAEAYVMRDLHKKKLKKEEEEERAKLGMAPSETAAKSSGCFFRPVWKKVHPSNPQRSCSAETAHVGTSDQYV